MADDNELTGIDSVVSKLELISATSSFIAVILPFVVGFLVNRGLIKE
jgi:hypothetical protein